MTLRTGTEVTNADESAEMAHLAFKRKLEMTDVNLTWTLSSKK